MGQNGFLGKFPGAAAAEGAVGTPLRTRPKIRVTVTNLVTPPTPLPTEQE